MRSFDLAPAALVRASAWPTTALGSFGTPSLELGGDAAAYRAAIDREREALWAQTAGDPRFMKALAFASPSLVERVELLAGRRAERSKRVRHAETSLYRYLARAASRTTPSGLWAGVALARFGVEDRVTPCAPRYAIAPDLAPFAASLRALGERVPYRGRAKWRINPTLRRSVDHGTFELLVRLPGGALEHRGLAATPGIERLMDRMAALGAGTLGEVAERMGADREAADAFAEAGVLVGGLALPAWFESPWHALDAAGEQLVRGDRASWLAATKRLAELSSELSSQLDELTPSKVARRLAEARTVVAAMVASLDVVTELPRAALRCDLGLAFDIVFGEARREQIGATLATYAREWLEGTSPMAEPRAARRRSLVQALLARGVPLGGVFPEGLASPFDPRRPYSLVGEPVARARDLRPGVANAALHDDVAAPWGGLFGRLGGPGISRVFGADDNPAASFARYGSVLGNNHEAARWLAERVADLRTKHGVITADLAVPMDTNPNVLARADMGALRIEPGGAGGPDLLGAELRAEGGAVVLRVPGVGRLSVMMLSSAYVLDQDAVAEQLLFTGFQERVGPAFRAAALVEPGEDDTPAHGPSHGLSMGVVIRARRTRLAGAPLARLLAGRGAARFAVWSALARELGWSRRVAVAIDGGPPLLLDPSSPLALEAALEGAGGARAMTVEDEDTGGWLAGRYVADVVVPFSRRSHAFSALVP